MSFSDFHVHTVYCDGKNTPEEIILSAIKMKMERLGFSGHSYTHFDESYCMSVEGTEEYKKEILGLKEKYKDVIKIYLGIEKDVFSLYDTSDFDYVIGSSHYLRFGEEYVPIDENAQTFKECVGKHYDGDYIHMAKDYFENITKVIDLGADMVGHLDIITKYNRNNNLFDESDPRYLEYAKRAIDKILKAGIPFEVNTGAIGRGHKDFPYPSDELLKYIIRNGGKVVLSSDSHSASTLCYQFEKWQDYVTRLRKEC